MKFLNLLLCFTLFSSLVAEAQPSQADESSAEPQDSTISVIAWFNKNEKATYQLRQAAWDITPNDTVLTSGVSSKMTISVLDSTSTGYKMELRYLDIAVDTISTGNVIGNVQNKIMDRFGKKICKTPILFETDELGTITAVTNIESIKKLSKKVFKDVLDELADTPEMKAAKSVGLDIKRLSESIDTDQLVDSYLEDLNMLFTYHGLVFPIGDQAIHSDASENEYENTTYLSVIKDDEDYYRIEDNTIANIPQADLKKIVLQTIGAIADPQLREEARRGIESADMGEIDATVSTYFKIDYLPDGWPMNLVKQSTSLIMGRGKVQQTTIEIVEFE